MRIRISHATTYRYETPPTAVTQLLRLTPRDYDGQYVANWRVDLSEDCLLHQHEDAFGNVIHTFTAEGPFKELSVSVEGEVDTVDTKSVVSGTVERFPPACSCARRRSPTPTPPSKSSRRAPAPTRAPIRSRCCMACSRRSIAKSPSTPIRPIPATTAAEAFALHRGVCQDLTHIFITAARALGIPARYIGGHFHRVDGVTAQEAGHAWAEAFIENLGWVGFDPTNGIGTTEAHVRVAVGLDYLGAAPVRGTRLGGSGETLQVAVQCRSGPPADAELAGREDHDIA